MPASGPIQVLTPPVLRPPGQQEAGPGSLQEKEWKLKHVNDLCLQVDVYYSDEFAFSAPHLSTKSEMRREQRSERQGKGDEEEEVLLFSRLHLNFCNSCTMFAENVQG